MKALVTRPAEDAEEVCAALLSRGLEPVLAPMMRIRLYPGASLTLDRVQAVLLTSANGARALAAATDRRDFRILTVGEASARKTRALGFAHVEGAKGDVDSLARLVRERLDPAGGALVHVAGSVVAGDLAGDLGRAGFAIRREVLYEAELAERLPAEAERAVAAGEVAYALFFSPRTAATFVTLAVRAGLDTIAIGALALSPNVAAQLAALPWRDVLVARRPEQEALFTALDEDRQGRRGEA
jgi:uroporphyrinogen-III synthase